MIPFMISEVCDNCRKYPQPFVAGNDERKTGETCFYIIVPKEISDPTVLMSDGTLAFKVSVTREHPILENEIHLCWSCFESMFEEEPEGEGYDVGSFDT